MRKVYVLIVCMTVRGATLNGYGKRGINRDSMKQHSGKTG